MGILDVVFPLITCRVVFIDFDETCPRVSIAIMVFGLERKYMKPKSVLANNNQALAMNGLY